MKCDELKSFNCVDSDLQEFCEPRLVYPNGEVDAAIAELKAENRKLKRALWLARANRAHAEWGHWVTIWFCDTAIKLNINKSSVSQDHYRCTIKRKAAIWRNIWGTIYEKCLKKAEEFK